MNRCSNPEHPHCTFWVMPGDSACASGHEQAAPPVSSFDMISTLRRQRTAAPGALAVPPDSPLAERRTGARPHLHISGFDPRAAGGRQALKLELRGLALNDAAAEIGMRLRSALIEHDSAQHAFVRTLHNGWRPVFIEFSSRGKEHGQHRIEVELYSRKDGQVARRWACTLLILVPRADATLTEIHKTFLSTHKNVRVVADDASIAKVYAQDGASFNLDVTARNASITHLKLDAAPGKVDLGYSTIAWDEELIEIDVTPHGRLHPHPSAAACLVNAAPDAGAQRQVRLFALDECVLGRFEQYDPEADVLLAHFGEDGQDRSGLTRRLSGRHALLRRGGNGFEIEDVSRFGLLVDGVWPGKHQAVALRVGMTIELTASIKGVVRLVVGALLPHGVIMHRIDGGAQAECFYFLEPERHPGFPLAKWAATPAAAVLPLLFHLNGGFWHLDPVSGKETALAPSTALELSQLPRHTRFAAEPYPESIISRTVALA